MKLNAPSFITFLVSFILVALAVLAHLGIIVVPDKFPNQNLWLAVTGYVVLMLGAIVRGM